MMEETKEISLFFLSPLSTKWLLQNTFLVSTERIFWVLKFLQTNKQKIAMLNKYKNSNLSVFQLCALSLGK